MISRYLQSGVTEGRGSSSSGPSGGAGDAPAGGFWSQLQPDDANALLARGVVRIFTRGQALCYEGQVPDRVLILRSGTVKVTSTTAEGREVVLAFRSPGDIVGELTALDDRPRAATVVAVDRVQALTLTSHDFRDFLQQHSSVCVALLRLLSLRLRDADAKRIDFARFDTMGRLAVRLIELSERFGQQEGEAIRIALPLSQEELAGLTGASLKSVTRALEEMRSLNWIETGRREIRILDPAALHRRTR
jgi:CRP/FNR family cyclic AMP-dependent transcriptional regulator